MVFLVSSLNKQIVSTFYILWDGKVVSLFSNLLSGLVFGGHDFFSRLHSIDLIGTETKDFLKIRIVFLYFEIESFLLWDSLFSSIDVSWFFLLDFLYKVFFFFFSDLFPFFLLFFFSCLERSFLFNKLLKISFLFYSW